MQSKCSRKGCVFNEEAVHMDEAIEKLRQHYRAVHPTKAFIVPHAAEFLESYNKTADEFMENYNIGSLDAPQYDWRHLRSQVARYRQDDPNDWYINLETLDELDRRVQENDANQPVEAQPAADVAENAAGPFLQWIEDDPALPRGMQLDRAVEAEVYDPVIDPGGRF